MNPQSDPAPRPVEPIDPADRQRLARTLARLARDGFLEFSGEYGAELTTFVPFVAWLKREGHLAGRRIVTYAGMRPYYFFLDEGEFEGKRGPRAWLPEPQRYWPSNSTYTATASPWHVYPDFRAHYGPTARRFDRPVLFVQNKFTVEWDIGPINYMPLGALRRLLELTAGRFQVVYSRPSERGLGYSADHNAPCDYPDRGVLADFPGVIDFEADCEAGGRDYNTAKLEILAGAHVFVAVQGGGAHLLAYFGRSVLLLLHREGPEFPHAYRAGPYKYLASPAPSLFVARSFEDFGHGVESLGRGVPKGTQLALPPNAGRLLSAMRA